MFFHITLQHDHITCPRTENGELVVKIKDVPLGTNQQVWLQSTDKVRVVGSWGYPLSHRIFAVIEAEQYEDVIEHFEQQLPL